MNHRRAWLEGLPKAELHVHLEGTITPQTYERIARRRGVALPDDLGSMFACSDFASFLRSFLAVVKTLREPEDFGEIATEYLSGSSDRGVLHVELFFSPATIRHFHKDADLHGILLAISDAMQAAAKEKGISSLLLLDLVRNLGEDSALADIDLARQCAPDGVIGIGLGGDERNFPARDFQRVFERAKRLGLRRTVHAGEAAGSQSVRDAIELLDAERIGHGVAAMGDERVLELVARRGVGIDSCPTSNRVTGAVGAEEEHPLGAFLRRGLNVTLSSDDPAFFGASLLDEYENAVKSGLSADEVIALARNSFRMSFAPEEAKQSWLARLDEYVAATLRLRKGRE